MSNGLLRVLADLLLPPACLGCDGLIDPRDELRLLCRRCRAQLRALPAPSCARCAAPVRNTGRAIEEGCAECRAWPAELACARAACLLMPPASRIVHQLKYRGWPALAVPMAERMAALPLPEAARSARLVVPVPTTKQRLRERGYNQAQELARAFAQHTGRELCLALQRTGSSGTQTTLLPVARRANVAGAFRVEARAARRLRAAHVLLVDDVLTTGATACACAVALGAAGARHLSLVTFARALDARRLTHDNEASDDD